MITSILKRNGSKEAFSAVKINHWGEWASKTLGNHVDWTTVVISAVNNCQSECSSLDLQKRLIETCLDKKTWEYNRMAGRLYAALIRREIYEAGYPSVKQVHQNLFDANIMVKLNYTDEEYDLIEKFIDHKHDIKYPHYQLNQIRYKYALRDKTSKREFETAQFVYMRMAMALAENEKTDKLLHVRNWYEHFAYGRINAPTPNFVNLGTRLNGYASCCVYTTEDTAPSLAAGDHIAYMMTCASAGIGTHLKTRSIKDPVRGGVIEHQGKLPYIRAMVGAIGANLQNGRGGASTMYYGAYDPEVEVIQKLRHPMTPLSKKIDGCHYSFSSNKTFARRVAKNEDYSPFSYQGNEEMYEAQYSGDQTRFETLYGEYEKTASFKLSAREIAIGVLTQSYETGVQYLFMTDTTNHHTPFRDKIYSSNLCLEISIPTNGFNSTADLYQDYKEGGGEIGLCSLAGIIVANIESDEQYAHAAYYALKMIDICIHKAEYTFKTLETTAKARLSAGVGIIGLAHLMAKENKKYDNQDGLNFIHTLSETHMWHLLNASLRLGKELGNAPWMHKTKWPEGWLPTDTYEKRVDDLITVDNKRNWEGLRIEIKANGGIRNSVLVAMMPGESSTIAAGTTNGLYPIRDLYIMKTSDTMVNHWAAPDGTKLKNKYQSAWDISTTDMIKVYAVIQKWTDQGISADLFVKIIEDTKVSSSDMIRDYLDIVKLGLKTRYYVNSLTSKGVNLETGENAVSTETEQELCESCSL
jgi:ribonucleoside-diphosphate reductase alpha chain